MTRCRLIDGSVARVFARVESPEFVEPLVRVLREGDTGLIWVGVHAIVREWHEPWGTEWVA